MDRFMQIINRQIALVGSNSIHTIRYLKAIAPYFNTVVFITNKTPIESTTTTWPTNIVIYTADFRLKHFSSHKKIANILLTHKINLVHIHQANSYAYHTIKATKRSGINCKVILTTWGSDILVLPKANLLFKLLVKYNLANSNIVTSDSLYMSAKIRELVPKVKEIHTINYGIQHLPPLCDISQKENIIFSNRLHKPLYNVDKVIIGFDQLLKTGQEFADYQLVVAASGTESEHLNELVNRLGIENKVMFLGMISYTELTTWYNRAKIFISIPNSDATSMSLLEALGHGCYPIVSNIPANLEWVIDEVNGTICQNNQQLDLDMAKTIRNISQPETLFKVMKFNYKLIKQKAIFNNNIAKFLKLYS